LRIVVLGDTHIPDFAKELPSVLRPHLGRADLILHTGDVTRAFVLDELAAFAPVRVALGNNDRPDVATWGAEPVVELDVDGVRITMIHDSGRRDGRERRLRRQFPDARVIVFGHSHIPVDAELEGVRYLNPGSPTWKRRQPEPTFARVTISGGQVRTRVVSLRA
jgi:putative phosphoesterase